MSNGLTTPFTQKINGSPIMHLTNAENIVKTSTNTVKLSYNDPTSLNYTAGYVGGDDGGVYNIAVGGTLNFTGLLANTTYHIFVIHNQTTNITQLHYDVSLTTPTLPSGFTKKKHIFSFITNASSELRLFTMTGNFVEYAVDIVADFSATPPSTVSTLTTALTIPANCYGELYVQWNSFTMGSGRTLWLHNPNDSEKQVLQAGVSGTGIADASTNVKVRVDGNQQLGYRTNSSSGLFFISTKGYYLYL